ncbi:MAG: AAA family ATPase, partial [Planctomycetota bacterium]
MAASPWDDFRRLCRYYRDCLRFDEHDSLRFRADSQNDTWLPVPMEQVLALGDSEDARLQLPRDPAWQGLLANALQHEDWHTVLGLPVLGQTRRGQDWLLPLLLLPLRVSCDTSSVHLRRIGPLLCNQAALALLYTDSPSRQACCERLGLVPTELGHDQQTQRYDGPLRTVLERLHGERVLPESSNEPQALIGIGKRGQFHRRLCEELHLLAEATPEAELAASALATIFGPEAPTAPDQADTEQMPLFWQQPLDPAQRRAITTGLQAPVAVVTGPPGTGKSTMVRHLLINQALRGRTCLVASRNHRALDAVEPAINQLGDGETLLVRTSHHGQRRSWRYGLLDLLQRDDADLVDPAASQAAFHQAAARARRLEAEADSLSALDAAYREACSAWSSTLEAAHAQDRAALTCGAATPPQLTSIAALRQRLQELLSAAGWQRLLPPGLEHKRRQLHAALQELVVDGHDPGPPDPDTFEAWQRLLDRAEAAASAAQAWQRCRELEARRQASGLERAELLRQLAQAHSACWRNGIASLVDRAVAGPQEPEDRERLQNLAAGVHSFGMARWSTVYADCFPTLLQSRPLWACSNLSAPATLPRQAGLFDLLVLDEASQCDIPSIIPLLFRCRRVLAVGDPQ